MPEAPGPIALVGSGEYLESMAPIEGALLAGRAPRYVQLATAAVPDGDATVARWHRMGREQAERLGVEPVILDVRDRAGADDPGLAAEVAGAGLVYLSGGHPDFLADTLRDTAVWRAIVDAWRAGAALAGCSAGAMVFAHRIPSFRSLRAGGTAGLDLLPHLRVIPHFDAFAKRMPDVLTRILVDRDESVTVLGVDEQTAVVGGPLEWRVEGRSSAWRVYAGGREEIPSGTTFSTPAD